MTDEEQRAVREDATEAELAIFDLLTKPEPELTKAEAITVRGAAKKLLERVEDKLVLDWKRRQQTRSAVKVTVKDVLDAELPEVYGPELFDRKVDAIFDHIYASYLGDGESVYDLTDASAGPLPAVATLPSTAEEVDDDLLHAVRSDPTMLSRLMETVFGASATWACSTEQLLIREESRVVEYKQTARWNVREQRRDKAMEQVVVKTVAGMLNDRGGSLLIGVTDNGEPVGLADDYAQVTPSNADAYVNWLDTLFENNLGHTGAHRLTIRIDQVNHRGRPARIDVPASSRPHLGQDQGRIRHPLPAPQQLNAASAARRGAAVHHRALRQLERPLNG